MIAALPLLGTAADFPRQPYAALSAAFTLSTDRVFDVGRVVTAQALFLAGVFLLYREVGPSPGIRPNLLSFSTSTLSYNDFPFLLLVEGHPADLLVTGLAVLGSTVFATAHFLGATKGYAPEHAQAVASES